MAKVLTASDKAKLRDELKLIDEQVSHVTLELVEGEGEKKGKTYARGEFGHAGKPTANGRFYPPQIWESNIGRLKPKLEGRKVLGELDHPSDGRTALQRASHVITDLRLEGDRVVGEAEILNTSMGRDLKAILEAGVPVGISSRGYGSTKPDGKGKEVVQEDYKLVTFDFVAEPADDTAYPEVFFEGAEFPAELETLMDESTKTTDEVQESSGRKFKMWTGPTVVKRIAKELKKVPGVSNIVQGTEHVIFTYEGDHEDSVNELAKHPKTSDLLRKYLKSRPGMPGGAKPVRESADDDEETVEEENSIDESKMKAGEVKKFDKGNYAIRLDPSGTYTAVAPAGSKDFKTEKGAMAWLRKRGLKESLEESVAARVSIMSDEEKELARKFLQVAVGGGDEGAEPVNTEALKKEFAAQILSHIGAMRGELEDEIRQSMLADPEIGGARQALEQVSRVLRPFLLPEDVNEVVESKEEEIASLQRSIQERDLKVGELEGLVEKLAKAAKESGYKYHLERLITGESEADLIRSIVGDVTQYESAQEITTRVEEAREQADSRRLEEAKVTRVSTARQTKLEEQAQELASGLEEAMEVNKQLALRLYASERLQTHPMAAKIHRMLEKVGFQSQDQIDDLIEEFREPVRDRDDLDGIRSRIRTRLQGGQEYLSEETHRQGPRSGGGNYNGSGLSLGELKKLSGIDNR